jgi:hypothetical protein
MICSKCGSVTSNEAKFCKTCGAKIVGEAIEIAVEKPKNIEKKTSQSIKEEYNEGVDPYLAINETKEPKNKIIPFAIVISTLIVASIAIILILTNKSNNNNGSVANNKSDIITAANNQSNESTTLVTSNPVVKNINNPQQSDANLSQEAAPNENKVNEQSTDDNTAVDSSINNNVSEQKPSTENKGAEINTVINWAVSASSNLLGDHNIDHTANLLIDNKFSTAWVEGVPGDGIGEELLFTTDKENKLSSIDIVSGYAKTNKTYTSNNRVKTLELSFSDGSSVVEILKDKVMGYQRITFLRPILTNFVKFRILEVYKGTKYEDTCISEIKLNTIRN